MLEKIDHVGIAVKSLDEAVKFYEALGVKPYHFDGGGHVGHSQWRPRYQWQPVLHHVCPCHTAQWELHDFW